MSLNDFKSSTIHLVDREIRGLFKLYALTQKIFWGDDKKLKYQILMLRSSCLEIQINKYLEDWKRKLIPAYTKIIKVLSKKEITKIIHLKMTSLKSLV